MKTIEEKAKAYDAAIVRAKAMIRVAANQDEAIGFANTIFPELKESESERIRKLLISGMKNLKYSCETFASVPIKDVIDWLEKQGENHADIDIDEMVDKFTRTELKFDGTICAVVDAYRKGITDALIKTKNY